MCCVLHGKTGARKKDKSRSGKRWQISLKFKIHATFCTKKIESIDITSVFLHSEFLRIDSESQFTIQLLRRCFSSKEP